MKGALVAAIIWQEMMDVASNQYNSRMCSSNHMD